MVRKLAHNSSLSRVYRLEEGANFLKVDSGGDVPFGWVNKSLLGSELGSGP